MLVYLLKRIPDLTLSKYQAFADSGIEGMLEAQTQFIRQLYRVALNGNISIHFYYLYHPEAEAGDKLKIYCGFSDVSGDMQYRRRIEKVIRSSGIFEYYEFSEIAADSIGSDTYRCMSTIRKKERILQTVVNGEENYFYVIPNWEMRENARLYSLFKLMQSFDERCCYRVDLYAERDLDEEIHKNFEKPLSYLRNISASSKGISEYSKLNKEKHDPNADETMHQYENWIKSVDSSYVYRARISAFSDDSQVGQLLLDSAVVESIESGNADIVVRQGNYKITDSIKELPDENSSEKAPKSLKKWNSTFTVEEIASFCRFPVLYDGEHIEMPKETDAKLDADGMILGTDRNGYHVTISPELFPKHMFVCGVPGAGKTNTMLHIANSLWNNCVYEKDGAKEKINIPFLVLEPAKKEYRELALMDIPELVIFSPSACTDFPMKINPFEFAVGLTLSEHIANLCQVFEGAFPIAPPAPFILDRAIEAIYKAHGWNTGDINNGDKEYPTMQELYDQFERELSHTNYDGEIKGNIQAVLEMRIGSLLRREKKEIFNAKKSMLSPEEWLQYPVIVELEALGEGPANFVTLLLCTLIREVLKVNPLTDKEMPVRHVIFIEEAHNLIAPEAQVQNGQDSNPKVAATAYIVKMLAEVRALREGIIIADQLPTAMAPEVIKNTNIKLVHRLTSADDRELVGSTMSASALQMEDLATYTSGQALYTYEKLLRPFEMQVSLIEEHGEGTPNDKELYRLMLQKPGYVRIRQREEETKFQMLKEEAIECSKKENEIIAAIRNISPHMSRKTDAEKEEIVNTFVNQSNGIELLKKRLLHLTLNMRKEFCDYEKVTKLQECIKHINESLQKSLVELINVVY